MNKSKIQKFAVDGHKLLYKQIAQRAYQYGIEERNVGKADATEVRGRILSPLEKSQRAALIAEINANGYPQTIERVTYIWFNRIVALRFMEVNNYLPSHIRVFSDASGAFKPEILNDVLHLEMEGLDKAQIAEYIENNNTEELYRYLLLTQCAELKAALPDIFVFGARDRDYTELLFPNNSLSGDSFIAKMLSETDEKEDWQDAVQIIGWLYQYYNDERKNEVINIYKGTVKKEDIPAATQLFTTDWVVRYMVDNSLGRYWIERHPESKLAEKLEFLATPKDGEINHIDEFVKPEDVKFLDPCMGSGHILVYAFDVLMEIYKESGYTERDAAAMIVQNNLFGLDIDDRASQLAYFAVMMKARSYDRRFLSRGIKPNVLAIKESNGMGAAVRDGLTVDAEMNTISRYLVDTFRDAKELGSIITIEPKDYDGYMAYLDGCDGQGQLSLDDADWLQNARPMLKALARQAKVLSAKYPVVCTNPPYLNKIEGQLKKFVLDNYKDYSGDLFSVFTYRNLMFCKQDGYCGYMTPFVWMFIKTYEKLREFIIRNKSIATLVQMEYSAFEEATVPICSFVLKNGKAAENGLYFKLSDFKGGMEVQKQKVLEALADKNCGYFYEADQSSFSKIPGSPVAYWISSKLIRAYEGNSLAEYATITNGLFTCDNKRFLRLWHEVHVKNIKFQCKSKDECLSATQKWYPYNKGGDFRRWYGNQEYIVNFRDFGAEISQYRVQSGQSASFPGQDFYFHDSVSWSLVSSAKFGIRYYPTGFVFDIAGSSVFPNSEEKLGYLLGFLASEVAFSCLKLTNPTINFQAGDVRKLPLIYDEHSLDETNKMSQENITLSRKDWDSYETSWDFKRHPLV
nr:BREX-1 system adenine-specific DNA-methyltransferase PglX [uncultured Agathobaculum sp.]